MHFCFYTRWRLLLNAKGSTQCNFLEMLWNSSCCIACMHLNRNFNMFYLACNYFIIIATLCRFFSLIAVWTIMLHCCTINLLIKLIRLKLSIILQVIDFYAQHNILFHSTWRLKCHKSKAWNGTPRQLTVIYKYVWSVLLLCYCTY